MSGCVRIFPLGKYNISIESACELSRMWNMLTVIIASRSTPVSSIAVIFGSLTLPFFARSSGLIVCGRISTSLRYATLLRCVMISVTPSATARRTPLVWSAW